MLCLRIWHFMAILQTYDMLFGIRVSAKTELAGLDVPELGGLAYPPDAEPSPHLSAAGIAGAAPAATAWQPPQLDQPLPVSLRVRSPQQNQAGHINPKLSGKDLPARIFQARPANPSYPERPASPSYPERPASPSYPERPASPNYPEGPASPNHPERPASPNSPSEEGIQSEAWWQNQRNRPRRITFDFDKQ